MNDISINQPDYEQRWLGAPVNLLKGTLEEMIKRIPVFERRPFSAGGENEFYDVIVRKPLNNGEDKIPVGIVSKTYSLIQHRDIINLIIESLKNSNLDIKGIVSTLSLTKYGERMEVFMRFPSIFQIDPGDGHKVGFSFWCHNSVDGSTKFSALFGWLRLVCLNGLVIFDPKTAPKERRHTKTLDKDYLNKMIANALANFEKEKRMLKKLYQTPLNDNAFEKWIDNSLNAKWGMTAATRAYHIAKSGKDIKLVPPNKNVQPSKKKVKYTNKVPGAIVPANNLYAVIQALSWLAGQRRDVEEQFKWMKQIPELIGNYKKIEG